MATKSVTSFRVRPLAYAKSAGPKNERTEGMLDWRRIVQDTQGFKRALLSRGFESQRVEDLAAQVTELAQARVKIQAEVNELQSQRNKNSQNVGELMKAGKRAEAQPLVDEGKKLGVHIENLEKKLEEAEDGFRSVLELVPNWPHESVPVGKEASENVLVREWGTKKTFGFEPRSHDELGEKSGLIDFSRAGKISGARFTFLMGELSQLERALINYMLDLHRKKGYQEISPPFIVSAATMYGMGQLPKFREDLFKVEGQDKFLIPTAEVPVTALFADEILSEEDLPKKFVAFSPCFRAEAGSYGIDTKGLIRQHQFLKVELVKFVRPEESLQELESMVADAEDVLKGLDIPFRTMQLCSGDMGQNARKTYDIEVWLPGSVFQTQGNKRGCYREISSCSDVGDYQARRAKIRLKSKNAKGTHFLHTLNGSGLAVGRTLLAVMENYQLADGSIAVPLVLQPYMNGLKVLGAKK